MNTKDKSLHLANVASRDSATVTSGFAYHGKLRHLALSDYSLRVICATITALLLIAMVGAMGAVAGLATLDPQLAIKVLNGLIDRIV